MEEYIVKLTAEASKDMEQIYDYIAWSLLAPESALNQYNRIAEAIEKYHAKLLILDPMSSYIGENCSMNNANETRAEFNHLIAVANRLLRLLLSSFAR